MVFTKFSDTNRNHLAAPFDAYTRANLRLWKQFFFVVVAFFSAHGLLYASMYYDFTYYDGRWLPTFFYHYVSKNSLIYEHAWGSTAVFLLMIMTFICAPACTYILDKYDIERSRINLLLQGSYFFLEHKARNMDFRLSINSFPQDLELELLKDAHEQLKFVYNSYLISNKSGAFFPTLIGFGFYPVTKLYFLWGEIFLEIFWLKYYFGHYYFIYPYGAYVVLSFTIVTICAIFIIQKFFSDLYYDFQVIKKFAYFLDSTDELIKKAEQAYKHNFLFGPSSFVPPLPSIKKIPKRIHYIKKK